jgi:hypothetical protein
VHVVEILAPGIAPSDPRELNLAPASWAGISGRRVGASVSHLLNLAPGMALGEVRVDHGRG